MPKTRGRGKVLALRPLGSVDGVKLYEASAVESSFAHKGRAR